MTLNDNTVLPPAQSSPLEPSIPTKQSWSLTDPSILVLIAVVAGVALGYWQPDIAVLFKPLGDVFLRMIKMAIGPIIFLTIVTGVSKMGDLRRIGRVGGLALVYFEAITTIAMARRVVSSSSGDGASSMTFWLRRWIEHSRSPR